MWPCLGLLVLAFPGFAGATDLPGENAERAREKPRRAPGVSFLLSVLVPGAGQLYNGDRRGYVYLGVEAASWFARISYHDASITRKNESRRFADLHWSYDTYHESRLTAPCNAFWTTQADSAIAALGAERRSAFYDELASDDDYRCGWDDYDTTNDPAAPTTTSPHRGSFQHMRKQSDDLRSRARLAVVALVLNRIVSGVDAFQTARNRQGSLHFSSSLEGDLRSPRAVVRLVRILP
jgi:hypothetical protein